MNRRQAIKWISASTAAGATAALPAPAQPEPPPRSPTDPDLLRKFVPWERVLTEAELATATALADAVLPADGRSPAASQVGVVDFLNEWVSAPYPTQQQDLVTIRGGLAWLNTEAGKRFGKPFAQLDAAEHSAICDDICSQGKAAPEFAAAATFFDRFRDLCLGGFYTTPEGFKDIGYIGNVPSVTFDGPPDDVLEHLGLKDRN